jgi:viologen exporter family transport system permease protein
VSAWTASFSSKSAASSFLKYWKLFEIGLQNTFVYRWNFLLRTIFGIVPLIGMIFIWRAVFESSGKPIAGYDYSSMIFYFMVTVSLDNLITPTEDEWQIAAEIREGRISAYLIKPMNYLLYRITAYLSYRLLYIAVVLMPILVLAVFFREYIRLPTRFSTWPVLGLSTFMAAGIQFFIAYGIAMLSFWILEISTIVFILYSFEYFLSGHVFPLDIMPPWLQGFLHWSPFTYELFFPAQIAMERVRGAALWEGLAIQAGWLIFFAVLARVVWKQGLRRYQAFGG